MIRWGVIGCGEATEKKSGPAFSNIEGSKIEAVMSRNADRARSYAERHGIKRDSEGLATSRHIIEAQLRAYIGRNTMDNESGFYYNIYPIDNTLRRAVEELKKKK
jgi:hypothetical protein